MIPLQLISPKTFEIAHKKDLWAVIGKPLSKVEFIVVFKKFY